jgi:TolB-like protein
VFVYLYLNGKFSTQEIGSPVEKSIAVRPFNYLGENYEKEYLANAMMLEIVNQLSQLKDLRVMSPTSVIPYINQTDKVIGKKINCSFILSGNLHVEEDNMNLILTLVNTEDESVIKAFNFKTELEDIIELPGTIAQSVARELHVELSEDEKSRIRKIPTLNLTAYDFFQRGREEHFNYWANSNNLEALTIAENFYNKALEYDSTFARAYTGLAKVYWEKNYWTDYFKPNFLDSVKILVNKAFSFDPELPEAYVMNGQYLMANGFLKEAEREYDKAIAINPNEWMAYFGKANLYYNNDALETIKNLHQVLSLYRGNFLSGIYGRLFYSYLNAGFIEQAVQSATEKVKLDGDSVQYYLFIGNSEYERNNYVNALNYSLKAYNMDSNHVELLHMIGWYYDCLKQHNKSIIYYKKIARILDIQSNEFGFQFHNLHRMGYSFYMNGDSAMADYYFDLQVKICTTAIEENRNYSDYAHYDLAGVQAFRGEKKKAYGNLEILLKKEQFPHWFAILVQIDPLFDNLRGDKRFEEFVNELQIKYLKEHERVNNWLQEQSIL